MNFWSFLKVFFLSVKTILSYLEYQKTIFLAFLAINYTLEKFILFERKHGLTPLQNFDVLDFFGVESFLFYPEYQKSIFSLLIFPKTQVTKNSIFWQKAWSKPFANNNFSGFLEISFCQSKEHFFLLRTSSKNKLGIIVSFLIF